MDRSLQYIFCRGFGFSSNQFGFSPFFESVPIFMSNQIEFSFRFFQSSVADDIEVCPLCTFFSFISWRWYGPACKFSNLCGLTANFLYLIARSISDGLLNIRKPLVVLHLTVMFFICCVNYDGSFSAVSKPTNRHELMSICWAKGVEAFSWWEKLSRRCRSIFL